MNAPLISLPRHRVPLRATEPELLCETCVDLGFGQESTDPRLVDQLADSVGKRGKLELQPPFLPGRLRVVHVVVVVGSLLLVRAVGPRAEASNLTESLLENFSIVRIDLRSAVEVHLPVFAQLPYAVLGCGPCGIFDGAAQF